MFYVAPGSRSTPLVTAAAAHPGVTICTHFDERGTAFMALGYAKATGRPAVWITSSGTALANGYPAIVEASMEQLPMILLTADRPPELRDTDANQTIRQDQMFGRYVEWSIDMPSPSDDIDPEYVLTTIDHAAQRSKSGPVHVNCMFREPLAPSEQDYAPKISPRLESWEEGEAPFTTHSDQSVVAPDTVEGLKSRLENADRPMIVLGRLKGDCGKIRNAVDECCLSFDAVYVADIGSQVRIGNLGSRGICHAEAILYGGLPRALTPDLVVQFGASPVSKRVNQMMQGSTLVVVDDRRRRIDPAHTVSARIVADPVDVLQKLSQTGSGNGVQDGHEKSIWCRNWEKVTNEARDWGAGDLGDHLSEQNATRAVSDALNENHVLTVASSNPVRHLDLCARTQGPDLAVASNRGASGIDGTIATAMGFGDGHVKRPCVLTGDLALLHDLNSLAQCASRNAVVVVLNNDGGGIFSYLPIREYEDVFESYFATPHGFSFEHAAAQFGVSYSSPATLTDLRSTLDAVLEGNEAALIEVKTDRTDNLEEQRRILKAMSARMQSITLEMT